MKAVTLLFLRLSLGALMLVWGADKFANPDHGVAVAETFYWGVLAAGWAMPILGALQLLLGVGVVLGVFRRVFYPVLVFVTGVTLVGVWRSIVDPWGWFLEDTNVTFFPSLIVFAAALVLVVYRDDDTIRLDTGKAEEPEPASEERAETATADTPRPPESPRP